MMHEYKRHGMINWQYGKLYEKAALIRGVYLYNKIMGYVLECACIYWPRKSGEIHQHIH